MKINDYSSTNRSLLASAAVVSLFVLSVTGGCKKNSSVADLKTDTVGTAPPKLPAISADFETENMPMGIPLGTDSFRSVYSSCIYDRATQYYILQGYLPITDDSLKITIYLAGATFPLNQPLSYYVANFLYSDTKITMDFFEEHGTVMLNSLDTVGHKIAGTFSGVLRNDFVTGSTDSIIVKNGVFNTTYTVR